MPLIKLFSRPGGRVRARSAHIGARINTWVGALALLACAAHAAAPPAPTPTTSAPQRIVTLSPHLAELVCAAGACERLVGVTEWSDFPAPVTKLPQIGNGYSIAYEQVLALQPDLVLSWDGGTPDTVVARLRALHLRVEPLRTDTLDSVADALDTLGNQLGTQTTAHPAAAAYRQRLDSLRAHWAGAKPVSAVFQIGSSPVYTVNRNSPISAAIGLCGGINKFAELPTLSAPISAESMLTAHPEVVIFGGDENQQAIRNYWSRLARNTQPGTFCAVNPDLLTRSTPRLLDGVQQVCDCLESARGQAADRTATRTADRTADRP